MASCTLPTSSPPGSSATIPLATTREELTFTSAATSTTAAVVATVPPRTYW